MITTVDPVPNPTTAPPSHRTVRRRTHHRPVPAQVPASCDPDVGTAAAPRPTAWCHRRQAAEHLGDVLAAATPGIQVPIDPGLELAVRDIPAARGILRQATTLTTAPSADEVHIRRTRSGRLAAIVLHAATWSLVLRPEPSLSDADGWPTASSWVFIDDAGFGLPYLCCCFDGDDSDLGWAWAHMTTDVLATCRRGRR